MSRHDRAKSDISPADQVLPIRALPVDEDGLLSAPEFLNRTLHSLAAPESDFLPTPGPLMTSVLALFGNTSYFAVLRNATAEPNNSTAAWDALERICRPGATSDIPFSRLSSGLSSDIRDVARTCTTSLAPRASFRNPTRYLAQLTRDYLYQFSYNYTANAAFRITTFLANEALLTSSTRLTGFADSAQRGIYSGDGLEILKPKRSIPAIIVVSALVLAQVIGVVGLAAYGVSRPTGVAATPLPLEVRAADKSGHESSERGDSAGLGGQGEGRGTRTAGVVG